MSSVSLPIRDVVSAKLKSGANVSAAEIRKLGGMEAFEALAEELLNPPAPAPYDPKMSPTYAADKRRYQRRRLLKEHQRSAAGSRGQFYGIVCLLLFVLLFGPLMCSGG